MLLLLHIGDDRWEHGRVTLHGNQVRPPIGADDRRRAIGRPEINTDAERPLFRLDGETDGRCGCAARRVLRSRLLPLALRVQLPLEDERRVRVVVETLCNVDVVSPRLCALLLLQILKRPLLLIDEVAREVCGDPSIWSELPLTRRTQLRLAIREEPTPVRHHRRGAVSDAVVAREGLRLLPVGDEVLDLAKDGIARQLVRVRSRRRHHREIGRRVLLPLVGTVGTVGVRPAAGHGHVWRVPLVEAWLMEQRWLLGYCYCCGHAERERRGSEQIWTACHDSFGPHIPLAQSV